MSKSVHRSSQSNAVKEDRSKELVLDATKVAAGQQALQQAQESLITGDPMTDQERPAFSGAMRITDETMLLLADIFDRYQAVLGVQFDSASVRSAIAFEKQQRPIVAQARMLSSRLNDQIIARRGEAALACLALFQTMKGASRFKQGAELRPLVKQVAALTKLGKRKATVPLAEPANPATIVAK